MSYRSFKVRSEDVRADIERLQKQLSDQQKLENQLKNTLEELHTHQEELRTQNADLIAAQAEVAESQRKYLNLFDHAPIGYFAVDRNGTIQEVNLIAAALLARARSALVKKPLWLYLCKKDRESFQTHFRTLLEGHPAYLETSFVRPKKEPVPVELHSIPIKDNDERPETIRIAVLDVTKRKDTERQLRDINQQLESILSTIPDIVFRLNPNGYIEHISPNVTAYGFEPEKLHQRHFLHLVSRQQRTEVLQLFTRQLQEGTPVRDLEIQAQTFKSTKKDQLTRTTATFSVRTTTLYSRDDEGAEHIIGIQGIAHDISEKKRQEELEQKNQHVEDADTIASDVASDIHKTMADIEINVASLKRIHKNDNNTLELLSLIEKSIDCGRNLTRQLLGFTREEEDSIDQ